MASAIQRLSARLNIPTACPCISLPGFKKTELVNILQFLSTSCLKLFIVLFVFVHLFLGVSWLGICGRSRCRLGYEQSLFSLCLSSKRARHTEMTTRVTEGALASRVFAA